MNTIAFIRAGYLLAAGAILLTLAIPRLRDRFLAYGPRDQIEDKKEERPGRKWAAFSEDLLDYFAAIKVPHSWFKHFYLVSVVSSLVWLHQLYTRGPLLHILSATNREKSMSFSQLILCWSLLAAQGSRRLYECISLAKPSRSHMWIGHYILGLLYYLAMGVAIWIEGSPALLSTDVPLGDASVSAPSIRTLVFLPVFLVASGIQHDAHRYLGSLRKYALPSHPVFERIIAPHYTAEVAIYFSLMFLAAPRGHLVNGTLLTVLVFVVVGLGVNADISKKWYMQKFDHRLVEQRWRMIPGLW
jgi:3-oxo-5-alpha-steroid 4-dehydrogenase 3 / polyprenol reductase